MKAVVLSLLIVLLAAPLLVRAEFEELTPKEFEKRNQEKAADVMERLKASRAAEKAAQDASAAANKATAARGQVKSKAEAASTKAEKAEFKLEKACPAVHNC